MRASDYMLTADEIRVRDQKRRRRIVTIAVVLLVAAIALLAARPVRRSIIAWQARRHAGKAFTLIEQQKWVEARDEAVAAYQLRQTEPAALRAVARFLSRTGQAEALDFWDQLGKVQKLTTQDLRDEAAAAFAANDGAHADDALSHLLKSRTLTTADWLLAAQWSAQKGAAGDAFSALDKIFADTHATRLQQFEAALMERSLGNASSTSNTESDRLRDAWRRVEKLAHGQDEVALNSLVVLAQQIIAQPGDASPSFGMTTAEIRSALVAHPLAKTPHQLLAFDLDLHADPARKEAVISEAIAKFKNGDPPSLVALARWVNGKGEYQRELEAIPLEKTLQNHDLFLQHVDALGALGRWEDIRQLLENERYPLDQVIEHMYLARCYAQLGQPTASDNNWQRALEAAGADAGKLMLLGDYAEKNGATEIAESAYSAVTNANPKVRGAWQGRLRLAQAARNTDKIHAVLAGMLKLWPNDTAIQNDEAYTRLLLMGSQQSADVGDQTSAVGGTGTSNAELTTLNQLAESLVQREPNSLPHRTLLALARLRAGHPSEALAVYQNLSIDPRSLTPSALAVHAAVLAANGHKEDAKTEAEQVHSNRLLPEEAALLSDLR